MGSDRTPAPTSLDAFRAKKLTGPGLLTCECGSQWWRALVAIEEGRPTSMSDDIECAECGTERKASGPSA